MLLTPNGLRLRAYGYQRLARTQTNVEDKRRMASTALALAQLAAQIERGQLWTSSKIDHFEREIAAVSNQSMERLIRGFLGEQRARLVAEERERWKDRMPILDGLLGEAISVTGADMGNIQIFDADSGTLKIAVSRGFDTPFLTYFGSVHADRNSACGDAMVRGARIIVPDVETSDIFVGKESGQILRDAGVRAVQSTPIVHAGQLVGMISTHWGSVSALADEKQKSLDSLIDRAATAIDAARLATVL